MIQFPLHRLFLTRRWVKNPKRFTITTLSDLWSLGGPDSVQFRCWVRLRPGRARYLKRVPQPPCFVRHAKHGEITNTGVSISRDANSRLDCNEFYHKKKKGFSSCFSCYKRTRGGGGRWGRSPFWFFHRKKTQSWNPSIKRRNDLKSHDGFLSKEKERKRWYKSRCLIVFLIKHRKHSRRKKNSMSLRGLIMFVITDLLCHLMDKWSNIYDIIISINKYNINNNIQCYFKATSTSQCTTVKSFTVWKPLRYDRPSWTVVCRPWGIKAMKEIQSTGLVIGTESIFTVHPAVRGNIDSGSSPMQPVSAGF